MVLSLIKQVNKKEKASSATWRTVEPGINQNAKIGSDITPF